MANYKINVAHYYYPDDSKPDEALAVLARLQVRVDIDAECAKERDEVLARREEWARGVGFVDKVCSGRRPQRMEGVPDYPEFQIDLSELCNPVISPLLYVSFEFPGCAWEPTVMPKYPVSSLGAHLRIDGVSTGVDERPVSSCKESVEREFKVAAEGSATDVAMQCDLQTAAQRVERLCSEPTQTQKCLDSKLAFMRAYTVCRWALPPVQPPESSSGAAEAPDGVDVTLRAAERCTGSMMERQTCMIKERAAQLEVRGFAMPREACR